MEEYVCVGCGENVLKDDNFMNCLHCDAMVCSSCLKEMEDAEITKCPCCEDTKFLTNEC